MQIDHPLHFDGRGRTAETLGDEHIRDLIELVLFTSPGERVNQPDFGSGLQTLIFGPASPEAAAAVQFQVQGALQQWLGELIQVEDVEVKNQQSALHVMVRYRVLRDGSLQVSKYQRESSV